MMLQVVAIYLLVVAYAAMGDGGSSADFAACAAFTDPNSCFLSQSPRCWWFQDGPYANSCAPLPPTPRPSFANTPMPTSTSKPCDLSESACPNNPVCIWIPGNGCKLRFDADTPAPTGTPKDCLGLSQNACSSARQCVFISDGIGCRPRPPPRPCASSDEDQYRACGIAIRGGVGLALNLTRDAMAAVPDGQRLAIAQKFWCENAPGFIRNVTAHCVRRCTDSDDNFYGVADSIAWCNNFFNSTKLPDFFAKFNCPVSKTCDEIVADGLAANSEVQAVWTGSAVASGVKTTALAGVLLAAVMVLMH